MEIRNVGPINKSVLNANVEAPGRSPPTANLRKVEMSKTETTVRPEIGKSLGEIHGASSTHNLVTQMEKSTKKLSALIKYFHETPELKNEKGVIAATTLTTAYNLKNCFQELSDSFKKIADSEDGKKI